MLYTYCILYIVCCTLCSILYTVSCIRFLAQVWHKIDPRSSLVRHLVPFLVEWLLCSLLLHFLSAPFHVFSFVVLFSCSTSFLVLSFGSHALQFRSCPPFVISLFPSLIFIVPLVSFISVPVRSFFFVHSCCSFIVPSFVL